jgi:hypothetical protein
MPMSKEVKQGCIIGLFVTVVGTIIADILLEPVRLFFVSIWTFFVSIWNFMFSPISICWGLFILLVVLSFVTLSRIVKPAFEQKTSINPKLELEDYDEDKVFDIIWTWKYRGHQLDIDSLSPFCPDCATPLNPPPSNFGDAIYPIKTVLYCVHCQAVKGRFEYRFEELQNIISLEIMGRINRGEWISRLKSQRKEQSGEK